MIIKVVDKKVDIRLSPLHVLSYMYITVMQNTQAFAGIGKKACCIIRGNLPADFHAYRPIGTFSMHFEVVNTRDWP